MTFREWCDHVGGVKAASKLLGKPSIYATRAWYKGERVPRFREAQNIIKCAAGLLDYNSIYKGYE